MENFKKVKMPNHYREYEIVIVRYSSACKIYIVNWANKKRCPQLSGGHVFGIVIGPCFRVQRLMDSKEIEILFALITIEVHANRVKSQVGQKHNEPAYC